MLIRKQPKAYNMDDSWMIIFVWIYVYISTVMYITYLKNMYIYIFVYMYMWNMIYSILMYWVYQWISVNTFVLHGGETERERERDGACPHWCIKSLRFSHFRHYRLLRQENSFSTNELKCRRTNPQCLTIIQFAAICSNKAGRSVYEAWNETKLTGFPAHSLGRHGIFDALNRWALRQYFDDVRPHGKRRAFKVMRSLPNLIETASPSTYRLTNKRKIQ